MQSEIVLVNLVWNGEASAFDLLVRRHYAMARAIARRYASNSEDIDDLVQESFVTAYERLGQLNDPEKFAGWLAAIVRNQGLMWQRQRANHPSLFSMDDDLISAGLLSSLVVDEARRSEQRNAIRDVVKDALASLNRNHRRLVQLHYFEGYDYCETAALLDIPINAVRGRLDRARTALRKELQKIMNVAKSGWEFNAEELDAIRLASWMAEKEGVSDRAALNAVYFDGKGAIVSTDTHRVFAYRSESPISHEPLLVHADMARLLRDQHTDARSGKMLIEAKEAILDLDNGGRIRAAVVDAEFPAWQKVVPEEFKYKFKVRVEHILNAVDVIARQRESELVQKLNKDDEFRILMSLLPADGKMTISNGQECGEDGLSWEIRMALSAEFSAGDEELLFAMNWLYLEQAVRALNLPGDAFVEFSMNEWNKPILTQAAGGGKIIAVTMPRARVSDNAEQSEQAEAS